MNELLIGIGGLVLAVLTYFAGEHRGKVSRSEDAAALAAERESDASAAAAARNREERERRISRAVETYLELSRSFKEGQISAALAAGVTTLTDSTEVAEFIHGVERPTLLP
jgi:hypothetical protein